MPRGGESIVTGISSIDFSDFLTAAFHQAYIRATCGLHAHYREIVSLFRAAREEEK
jgi:hypothetical protein